MLLASLSQPGGTVAMRRSRRLLRRRETEAYAGVNRCVRENSRTRRQREGERLPRSLMKIGESEAKVKTTLNNSRKKKREKRKINTGRKRRGRKAKEERQEAEAVNCQNTGRRRGPRSGVTGS